MTRADRWFLALVALAVFLPGIGSRDLWNPDEPRYAVVAREMRESGEWFVPHLNGRIYAEKPPLQFWAIAACSYLTGGVGPVAARLPAVAAATATVLLLAALATRLFDRRVAWWAALIFLSAAKILWQGRIGQIDMLLVALVTAAMYSFVRGLTEERPGFHLLFFLFAGLATLAKGPVGLLPPLLSIVVWALATGNGRVLREMRIGRGLLVWAAVVAAWLVPAALHAGGAYFETMVFKQNLGRFADPWHHFRPWHYYLTVIPADFFPWSFFLPGAIWIGWRRVFGEARRGVTLALAWSLTTLVFFSLSPAKRTVYVLTMYPALALLVAASFAEIESGWPRFRRLLTLPAGLAALTVALATGGGYVVVRHFPERLGSRLEELAPMGPGLLAAVLALGVGLAACLQLGWLAARRNRPRGLVHAFAFGAAATMALAAVTVAPRFDAVKSARPLAAELIERAAPGDPYAIWPRLDATFLFHVGRPAIELASVDELYAFAQRRGRVWLLVEKDDLAKLPAPLPLVEVARDAELVEGYVLMTNPAG